ncbi:MAG TPA: tetratricopeptide repeat protein, partial [candidate division Zixibacteria bacterium]
MSNPKKRVKFPGFLNKKQNIIFVILGGGVLGIVVIYLILSSFFSGPSKEAMMTVKEFERVSSDFNDYLDGLPQTQNIQLRDFFEKAFASYQLGKYPAAISGFNACLQMRVEDKERVALLLLNGNCYFLLGNITEAEALYLRALVFAERNKEDESQAAVWGNLGLIYRNKGSLDTAQNLHQNALYLQKKLGNKKEEAIQLSSLGMILQTTQNYDQALQIHRESLR